MNVRLCVQLVVKNQISFRIVYCDGEPFTRLTFRLLYNTQTNLIIPTAVL